MHNNLKIWWTTHKSTLLSGCFFAVLIFLLTSPLHADELSNNLLQDASSLLSVGLAASNIHHKQIPLMQSHHSKTVEQSTPWHCTGDSCSESYSSHTKSSGSSLSIGMQ